MSKNLQIIVGLAVLLIAGSVFYYFVIFLLQVEQKETKRTEAPNKDIQKMVLIQLQKDCGDQYYKLLADEEAKDINKSVEMAGLMCQTNPHTFKIGSIFTCKNGLPYVLSEDEYVPLCIDHKIKEINL